MNPDQNPNTQEKREIYLDNSATTRVCPEAVAKITEMLTENYGNPSSLHAKGLQAQRELESARQAVAGALDVMPKEIYFTSGGTEANNLALFGAAKAGSRRGKRIVSTAIEHPSVLEPLARLEKEDIGLQMVNITIQDAEPPTAEVLAAFKEVETAKQSADTAVNNANKYRSEQIPAAEAEADKILQNAQAQKEARINEAMGQVARFNSMYQEYARYPLITKQRMYYETMEEVLPDLRVIIQDGSGSTVNLITDQQAAAISPSQETQEKEEKE